MSSWPHLRYQGLEPRLTRYHELVSRFLDGSQFLLVPVSKENKMAETIRSLSS